MTRTRRQSRLAGMALVYTLVILAMLVGFVSFGADWGRVQLVKTQLQRTANAAARAAARQMSQGNGITAATNEAVAIGAANIADGTAVTIDSTNDVEFGSWDDATQTFTVLTGANQSSATAVRVWARRTAARGNAVSLTFAKVLGFNTIDVSDNSVATFDDISKYGIVGIDSMSVNNVDIDSYNSTVGIYGGSNVNGNANLASNGGITFTNSCHVHSEVHPGIGYSVTKDGGTELGIKTPFPDAPTYPLLSPYTCQLDKALNYPVSDTGSYATNNNNATISSTYLDAQGNLSVSGTTLKIAPGVYYFKSVYTAGNGHLDFTLPAGTAGQVTFFVTGNVTINGKIFTNQQNTHNFLLEVVNSGTTVLFNSPEIVYGVVYCPLSTVTISNGKDMYGSVVGKTLSMDGHKFHYDESLADGTQGGHAKKHIKYIKPKHVH